MALVDYCDPAEAPDHAREILESYNATNDRYASLQLVIANDPVLFEVFDSVYRNLVIGGDLEEELEHLTHVTESLTNDCEYCIESHSENLIAGLDYRPRSDRIDSGRCVG